MTIARSKVSAKGQITVPVEVRRRVGIGPGSIVEWDTEGDQAVVRRVARNTSEDVHNALFPTAPKHKTLSELQQGRRRHISKRHAERL